jgi:hypothetical protein
MPPVHYLAEKQALAAERAAHAQSRGYITSFLGDGAAHTKVGEGKGAP